MLSISEINSEEENLYLHCSSCHWPQIVSPSNDTELLLCQLIPPCNSITVLVLERELQNSQSGNCEKATSNKIFQN